MARWLVLLLLVSAIGAECARAAEIQHVAPMEAPAEAPAEMEEEQADDAYLVDGRLEGAEARPTGPIRARLGGETRGTPPTPPPER